MSANNTPQLDILPTEILFQIFHFLKARELVKCRMVCQRWLNIVDALTADDLLWKRYCRNDFNKVHQLARSKARCGLHWYDIYKSLSLWPKLSQAAVEQDEFASAVSPLHANLDIVALNNGILGVHNQSAIVYYDVETLQQCKREAIAGHYLRYTENSYTIAVLNVNLSLYVIRKVLLDKNHQTRTTFDDVKMFLLNEQQLYYVTLNDSIYKCDLTAGKLTSEFQVMCPEQIMCLSFKKYLHVLTFKRLVYVMGDKTLLFASLVDGNILDLLKRYSFLEHLDWHVYYEWLYALNLGQPTGLMHEVTTVKVYNEVVFVGTRWGILRVYYAPYVNGVFDFFKSEPVKQWELMDRRPDFPVLSHCPIIHVEVLEAKNGHTVLVVMPKKIVALNLLHDPTISSRAVTLFNNYSEAQSTT